ncbi:MAG: ABC transporter ATP-binding protein [bacterium]|nr:ABC transporter ATP-binding protein [bacterium]
MQALSISGLKKTYKNNTSALQGIDLTVNEGDFFALLGPNGAGKSTAIGIISCLVNKTGGSVKIFEHDIDTENDKTKTFVGLVPQEFNFSVFERVLDIVINQAGYYGIPRDIALERAEYYLTRLDLWHKRSEPSRALSGGMKRKLMIARALIHRPKLLILDEPTAGVDVETRRQMWDFMTELNEGGTTIILTTHYLEEAEKLCKNVAIINKGKIIENTSIKKLLAKFEKEVFIFFVSGMAGSIKPLSSYNIEKLDDMSLKVELSKGQNISEIVDHLRHEGIIVETMKNRSNKLEELFINLVNRQ